MYKILYTAISIFWDFDIVNLSFMEIFDTTYPINTLAWILVWAIIPITGAIVEYTINED